MDRNNKLALYIAYFLARFNKKAFNFLNYGNQEQTYIKIGEILDVKASTIRNMVDEFDPLFPHRKGRWKRLMSPSRIHVTEILKDFSFDQVHALVNDILVSNGESLNAEEISNIVQDNEDIPNGLQRVYTSRGITGAKAEEIFKNHFSQIIPTFSGELIDTTLDGTGYDFKNSLESIYVEVKGSANDQKGILLTDKEWEAAKRLGDSYYLVLIYLINENPTYLILKNPANSLSPKLSIQRTITINWNVSHVQMHELVEDPKALIIDIN